jgi:hypothetical protein
VAVGWSSAMVSATQLQESATSGPPWAIHMPRSWKDLL